MSEHPATLNLDRETVHTIKNQLAVVLSYVELLTAQAPDDPRRLEDLVEIKQAAITALALLTDPGPRVPSREERRG